MRPHFGLIVLLTSLLLCLDFVGAAKHKHKHKHKHSKKYHGPNGMGQNDFMTCDQFAKHARFNPYSVLFETWFVFYYWGSPRTPEKYVFTFPTKNNTRYLRKLLKNQTIIPIDWERRHLLMRDENNETSLLVERGDRGQYWHFHFRTERGAQIRPIDIRLKQVGANNNTLLGLMHCDSELVLVMSKIDHVPPKYRLQDEAARIGYVGRRGKSYLYQGHEWMPIPEADESNYWYYHSKTEKDTETFSNEFSSEEQASAEGNTSGEEAEQPDLKNSLTTHEINPENVHIQVTEKKLDSQETNVTININSKDEQDKVWPNTPTQQNETADKTKYGSDKMQSRSKESVRDVTKKKLDSQETNVTISINYKDKQDKVWPNTPTQQNETADKTKYGSDKMQSQSKESVRDVTKKKLDTQETNVIINVDSKDEQDNVLPNTPTQKIETVDKSKYGSDNIQSQSKESVRDLTKKKLDSQETNVIININSKDEQDKALQNTPTQKIETVDKSKYGSDNIQSQPKESGRDQTNSEEDQTKEPSILQNKIEEPKSLKKMYDLKSSMDPQLSSAVYGQLSSDNDQAKVVPSNEEEVFDPEDLDDRNLNVKYSTLEPVITESGNENDKEISVRPESYQTSMELINNTMPATDIVEL